MWTQRFHGTGDDYKKATRVCTRALGSNKLWTQFNYKGSNSINKYILLIKREVGRDQEGSLRATYLNLDYDVDVDLFNM